MRPFYIVTICCIGVMACGVFLSILLHNAGNKIADQEYKIKELNSKLIKGNTAILNADSVIKANTIYVGPKVHDTIIIVKPDTVFYFRWLTDRKFKHAK